MHLDVKKTPYENVFLSKKMPKISNIPEKAIDKICKRRYNETRTLEHKEVCRWN